MRKFNLMICENSINFYECNSMICEKYWCNLMICEKYWWNLMICEKYWSQSKLQINDYMLDLMPGEENTYLSYDTPLTQNGNCDVVDDVHTLKFLNTINASGLPHHKIRLKIRVPIMLLRNIDLKLGLCNGTRLIITRMGKICAWSKGYIWK